MYVEQEDRIRRRAYEIWEREGRPEGRAEAHWDMAREEIAAQDNQRLTTRPNPARGPDDYVQHPEPVEPRLAVENQGEFPGLADQGQQQYVFDRPRRREDG